MTVFTETTANLIKLMLGVDAQWVVSGDAVLYAGDVLKLSFQAWIALGHAIRASRYRRRQGYRH